MTSFVREGAVLMTWSRRNFWGLVLRIVLVVTRRAEWRGGEWRGGEGRGVEIGAEGAEGRYP